VGVAHGYEFPTEAALASSDFSGGVYGAVRMLTRMGFTIVDDQPTLPPSGSSHPRRVATQVLSASVEQVAGTDKGSAPTAVLVGCVKGKRAQPALARDLYTSDLFRKRRRYAEGVGVPWFILSALHGFVRPGDLLEPYDMALQDQSRAYRRQWGLHVVEALAAELGSLHGAVLEVHAGASYVDAIEPHVRAQGAQLALPLRGLAQGQQLQWYLRQPARRATTPVAEPERTLALGDAEAEAHRVLSDMTAPRTVRGFPWGRPDLQQPGLYSWWVGDIGAAQLSAGLGQPVAAGLVYAGQAGATSSRSGKEPSATLASRIGGNHLRGRITSSTWRQSLAAILAEQLGLQFGVLGRRRSEEKLSQWMFEHLSLSAHACADRVTLAALEEAVLVLLDPPLNLQGMAASPVRLALRTKRASLRGSAES
jgi:hypothetical protein